MLWWWMLPFVLQALLMGLVIYSVRAWRVRRAARRLMPRRILLRRWFCCLTWRTTW